MIGVVLVLEGFHEHVDKKFIYISIAFSFFVELMNIRMRKKSDRRKGDTNNDQRDVI